MPARRPRALLKSKEERKSEALEKLHKLPIEQYHTREEVEGWREQRLRRELKKRGVRHKVSTRGKCAESLFVVKLNAGGCRGDGGGFDVGE